VLSVILSVLLASAPAPSSAAPTDPERVARWLWPRRAPEVQYPAVRVGADGQRKVVTLRLRDSTRDAIKSAEPAFMGGRYAEAAEIYVRALKDDPDCHLLWSHLADLHWFRGDLAEAARHQNQAIALLPTDHRLYFNRARLLNELGRRDAAFEDLVTALVLHPGHPAMGAVLQERAAAFGVRYDGTRLFQPRSYARKASRSEIEVGVDPVDPPYWRPFGVCKAAWLLDRKRAGNATARTGFGFSAAEERECVTKVLTAYREMRGQPRWSADPGLERLRAVADDGLLDAWIAYELATRVDPWSTLTLADAQRDAIRRYVKKYVLVRR
jgi:tetratricopeptide (TPR) repeat protein